MENIINKPFIESLHTILIYVPFSLSFKVKKARLWCITLSHFGLKTKKPGLFQWSYPDLITQMTTKRYVALPHLSKISDVQDVWDSVCCFYLKSYGIWGVNLWPTQIRYSPVYSEHTGKAAGPCWLSEPNLVHGRLQTQTPVQARLPPAGPPFPWRCSQIYPNLDPSPSLSLLHRGAPLCRAELGPYLSPSQCPERTTVNQKPLL